MTTELRRKQVHRLRREGREAYAAGKPPTACPYRTHEQLHDRLQWLTGYEMAVASEADANEIKAEAELTAAREDAERHRFMCALWDAGTDDAADLHSELMNSKERNAAIDKARKM